MTKLRIHSIGRYIEKTNAALSVPPDKRNAEQKRLVTIVEKSPTYSAIFGKETLKKV